MRQISIIGAMAAFYRAGNVVLCIGDWSPLWLGRFIGWFIGGVLGDKLGLAPKPAVLLKGTKAD